MIGVGGFVALSPVQRLSDALTGAQIDGWSIVGAIVTVVVAYPLGAFLRTLTMRGLRGVPGLPDAIVVDAGRLARWMTYLVSFAIALDFLGVRIRWFGLAVGVALVLVFLMTKPMVESMAAGLLLTMRPSFAVGDQISTGDYRGSVLEIGTRSTVLRTSDGCRVHVPNTEVLSQPIVVYTAFESRKGEVEIKVEFGTDLAVLTDRLTKAISGLDGVETDPAPSAQASGYEGAAITISISFWYPSTMTSDSDVLDRVVRAINTVFSDNDVVLASTRIEIDGTCTAGRAGASRADGSRSGTSPSEG